MTQDLKEAITDVDVVVGITFVSMTQGATEEDMKKKLAEFMPYQINSEQKMMPYSCTVFRHIVERKSPTRSLMVHSPMSLIKQRTGCTLRRHS